MQILVGGTGRCGTTILGRILALHSKIYTPAITLLNRTVYPEIRFLTDPDGCLDLIHSLSDEWSPQRASSAVKRFVKLLNKIFKSSPLQLKKLTNFALYYFILPKFNISGPQYGISFLGDIFPKKHYQQSLKKFLNEIVECEFSGYWVGSKSWQLNSTILSVNSYSREDIAIKCGNFVQDLFSYILKSRNKQYWCDTTPANVLHAKSLLEMFPDAKIIHIYRDPRDVICSYNTKIWGGKNILNIVEWIKRIWERWWLQKSQLNKDTYLEIKLEDLINYSSDTLSCIFEFLDLSYDNIFFERAKTLIKSGNIGRWKTDMKEHEKEVVLSKLQDIIETLGY